MLCYDYKPLTETKEYNFLMMIFPVGLKYHKKYYFWLLEAWLYIWGGIHPYTIFHNYNLKWDGSAYNSLFLLIK
jgi:hypothetical protein